MLKATLLVGLAAGACAGPRKSTKSPWVYAEKVALANGVLPGVRHVSYAYDWTEAFFPNFVDQFNWVGKTSADTYQQRYLVNNASWGGPGSPIFFYCGNEGFIELFANNTGLVWELAPAYKALVVFAEHRYYGLSMPFGNASYEPSNLGPLSIEQALADYANLVASLKANLSAQSSPVIAFGGSYGGMLAAWQRMRYPHLFAGAIASSAPILQIPGVMDPRAYNHIITDDFLASSPAAPAVVAGAFAYMLGATATDWATITSSLKLCGTINNIDDLYNAVYYISGALGFMAMADYPYPTSFLGPMPAYPVAAAAEFLNDASAPPTGLLSQVAAGVLSIFYNYTGQAGQCFNTSVTDPPGLQGNGWGVQCCKEVVQPIGTYGLPSDFFWPAPFDEEDFIRSCKEQFDGLTPRPNAQLRFYGDAQLRGASNMFLSSGSLDPWFSGDVVMNSTKTAGDVTVFIIEGGAHHLDLRSSNPADPPSVTLARQLQRAAMDRWIAAY